MKVEKSKLAEAISFPASIVKGKIDMPILQCLLLQADGKRLTVRSSDQHQFSERTLDCKGKLPGICVPVHALAGSLPFCAETVELDLEDGRLVLDGDKFNIGTFMAEEHVKWPTDECEPVKIAIADLCLGIEAVSFAASRDVTSSERNAVHVFADKKRLAIEATTGVIFAQFSLSKPVPELDFLLPLGFAANLVSELAMKGAKLSLSPNLALVEHVAGRYACKLVDKKFPNTAAFMSAEKKELGTLQPGKWKPLFKAVVDMTGHDPQTVPLVKISGGKFTHSGRYGNVNLPAPEKLKDSELNLNANNFPACLSAFGAEKVKVSVAEGTRAIVMEAGNLTVITAQLRG